MEQLVESLALQEVRETLTPTILELHQDFYQLSVVLKLWIHNFNVLVVLSQETLEVSKGFLDSVSQISDGLGLSGANPPKDTLGS